MVVKILATADLHLGKSASGISGNFEEISTKYTWWRIVDWSVRNKIDVLLLCGDIIDQDNRYFEAVGALQSGFEKLRQAGITVCLVTGNHDHEVLYQIVGNRKYENVHLLGFNGKWEILPFEKDGCKIQFVGWSFPNRYVTRDPLISFGEIHPDPNSSVIGLLHGDVDNMESKYGPIGLNNLANVGVNLWILGHIHKPQELRKYAPSIWYPGSPHAMSAKETGIHGPLLVSVEDSGNIMVTPVPLSPIRYENLDIDITNITNEAGIRDTVTSSVLNDAIGKLEELENVSLLIYDLHLTGQHADTREVEAGAQLINEFEQEIESGTRILVRKVTIDIRPAVQNLEELAKQPSPAGILATTILAIQNGNSTPFLEEFYKQWNYKQEDIINTGTYQPLRSTGRLITGDDKAASDYILHECNRLLGELITQQEN
ncbi:MAG TPA: DNA repair exonuclease [Hanamia sp.]|nr:DNA repair exonuclease [Hanamia sp.]